MSEYEFDFDPAKMRGCAVLLMGVGLFVAGVGFGALYLVSALKVAL